MGHGTSLRASEGYNAYLKPLFKIPDLLKHGHILLPHGLILLLRLFGHRPDIDLGLLTAFILDMVNEVDASVGPFIGESYLMWVEKRGDEKYLNLGPLKPEVVESIRTRLRRGAS